VCEHLGGKFPGVTRPVVEGFFGSLKQERVQWRNYQSRYEAQQDILEYIPCSITAIACIHTWVT